MYITPDFKRRIHIMGKPDDVRGYMLKVYDTETSEEILNIACIELLLDVREQNVAKITYYEYDEQGKPVFGYDGPHSTVTVDNPSLNLTARELASQRPQG